MEIRVMLIYSYDDLWDIQCFKTQQGAIDHIARMWPELNTPEAFEPANDHKSLLWKVGKDDHPISIRIFKRKLEE